MSHHQGLSQVQVIHLVVDNYIIEKSKPVTKILETPVGVYHGCDVLEGFAAHAEHLGRETPENNNFDKDFYNLCKLDNLYIFEFKGSDSVKLPAMKMSDLNSIIKHMKPGKACDYYQMTAEHLKHTGPQACQAILNRIIEHIYFLTCPTSQDWSWVYSPQRQEEASYTLKILQKNNSDFAQRIHPG